MKNNKMIFNIVFSILLCFCGIMVQIIALFLARFNYIDIQTETTIAFLSFLFVGIGFFLISNILPNKFKLIKIFLYLWGLIATIGNVVYFAWQVIK